MNSIFNQADFFHRRTPILICLKKLIHTLFVFVCFFQQIKIGSAFTTLEEFVVGKVYVPLTKRKATTICVGGAVQQSTYLQTVFYKIHEYRWKHSKNWNNEIHDKGKNVMDSQTFLKWILHVGPLSFSVTCSVLINCTYTAFLDVMI